MEDQQLLDALTRLRLELLQKVDGTLQSPLDYRDVETATAPKRNG